MSVPRDLKAVTALFDRCAPKYDSPVLRFVPYAADVLVEAMNPRPGMRFLDVGTGTGSVAIAAAQRVIPEGRVSAIDVSERMLDRAFANATKNAVAAHIDFFDMDAQALEYRKDYFDKVALCDVLAWLPDPLAALRSIKRVMKPGAAVHALSFAETAFQPMLDLFRTTVMELGGEAASGDEPGNPLRFADPTMLKHLFEEAGFADVETRRVELRYHLARADEWWEIVTASGIRAAIEDLPADSFAKLRLAHLDMVDGLVGENGLPLDCSAVLVTAKRPFEV
ncbi:MAG: class I SAM-dependent methyltransferase [Gammaproteobacteria bacterium]|nr:class I SAM-dependent methyltransferase [Gammaproteobacteria bacterium]MCP5137163.1 class I SAM-dependent methyltransferase [Gammaproteobacteria bacterium]